MLHQITSAALSQLGDAQKRDELSELVANARSANGSASAYLQGRIHAFEERYEMTSSELLRVVADGSQRETADIAKWLFLLNSSERHAHKTRS